MAVSKAVPVALVMLLSGSMMSARGHDKGGQLPLQFETIFPHSPYSGVKRLCVQVWQDVLDVRGKNLPHAQWQQFNDRMIDSLLHLYARIVYMLSQKKACSPDDIEHLMEVLQLIHREYISVPQLTPRADELVCGAVLFTKIENTLEKILE